MLLGRAAAAPGLRGAVRWKWLILGRAAAKPALRGVGR